MDLDNLLYIVVLVGWLVYTWMKKKKKPAGQSGRQFSQPATAPQREPERPEVKEPLDFETLLGELLTGEKKPSVPEPAETLETLSSAEGESLETYEKKPHAFSSYETLETFEKEGSHVPLSPAPEETGTEGESRASADESIDMRKAVIYSAILDRPEY